MCKKYIVIITMTTPYNPIKIQNQALQNFISSTNDYYSLERNQFVRKTERLPILGYIQNGLLILYAVVYIVFIIVLFIKAKQISIYLKIVLVVLFTLYPFFIYSIENAIYQVYYYVYAVMYGESYHTIMARKGLQNPKNFKDITNLSYNMGEMVSSIEKSPYITVMQEQIQNLPENIKTGFSEFQKVLPNLSFDAQNYLLKLQQDWVNAYNQTMTRLISTTNTNEIESITNEYVNDIRVKIANFWVEIRGQHLSDDIISALNSAITNLKNIFNIT